MVDPRAASRRPPEIEFSQVRLLVRDFGKSWRFYHDTLGLTPSMGNGQPPYGEFVTAGGPHVAIFERSLMATAVGLASGRYSRAVTGRSALIFSTSDVDAFARRLRGKKVRLLQGPTDRPLWRLRTIHLQDPDGYLIEVYSPLTA